MAGETLAKEAAQAADSKKAENIILLDMHKVFPITDFFIICSASSVRQVRTIALAIEDKLAELGLTPFLREGEAESGWVLLDYIDFVVHIFRDKERDFYRLERLWKDAPTVSWQK